MNRPTRLKARLSVLTVGCVLGSGAFIGAALPAHTFVMVTCASAATLSTTVFGFGCPDVGNTPQPGIISSQGHSYFCGVVERSPLIGDVTGYTCIEEP
jgi:hypothetical protein